MTLRRRLTWRIEVGVSTCWIVANCPSWTTWPLLPRTGSAAMLSADETPALALMIRMSIEVWPGRRNWFSFERQPSIAVRTRDAGALDRDAEVGGAAPVDA